MPDLSKSVKIAYISILFNPNVKLKESIKQLIYSADSYSYHGIEERKKSILLDLFFNCYFFVILIFLIFYIFSGNIFFLIFNTVCLLAGLLLYYLFRAKRMLRPVANIFVITIAAFTVFLILTGGINNTALVFSLLIPVPAILLLGRHRGLIVLGIFLFLNVICFVIFRDTTWFPDYDMVMVSRVAIVFVLISLMIYGNESVFRVLYQGLEKLSESLKISQQRYKTLAVNKEKFVSLVSHTLGDHIGKFAAMATLLHDEYQELSEQRRMELIRNLASISRQNHKLLDDLQKWATVQSDTIPFSPKPIKLEKIYKEVTELFNPLIEEKKLSFFLKMKSNSEIFADEIMVGAILRGLVSNAIKFSYAGGEVKISAREDLDKMAITVSDTGVGMSEKDLMRINASFSFSKEGTCNESGTGIGLILVKEFLQKHHGDFHVESRKGKGTEVTFTLPLAE
jgi:signal transduction histidine kinase